MDILFSCDDMLFENLEFICKKCLFFERKVWLISAALLILS